MVQRSQADAALAVEEGQLPDDGVIRSAYGYFDATGREYVITDIKTPRPWANVLANEDYGLVISQLGGGFSWGGNCQLFRLTRWDQDLASDSQGRFLYVRDLERADSVWSTTYQPTQVEADFEEVRHALGSTTFIREVAGIRTEHCVFVPTEDACEVWLVRVTNQGTRRRNLRLASYLEWHLGAVGDWHREFHRLFMEARVEPWGMVAWKHPGLPEGAREPIEEGPRAFVAWKGAGTPRWITDKTRWLGRYGATACPQGLFDEKVVSSTSRWDDPVSAGVVDLLVEPGETRTLAITIGVGKDVESCARLAEKYTPDTADAERAKTRIYWSNRCASLDVSTPDRAFDVLCNSWLPYQTICGRMVARCAYYQQGGAYGYRDQLQDSLALLATEPETTLKQLELHAGAMFQDGSVKHWWHPGTPIYAPSHHSDTSVWLAYGALAYLDETSDIGALSRVTPYAANLAEATAEGTLLEHMFRGLDRALSKRSARGLPLIGSGDWNDGLSHAGIDGKGESVWLAMFVYDVLQRLNPYLGELGMSDEASRYAQASAELKEAVNKHAWDGEWFIAGTRDDGKPLGGRECAEGQIFLNPQTWSVITGIADSDRRRQAMESVRKRLLKPYGALLLAPAYKHVDPYIGYITRYAPGLRENGGVYSHASTWAIQAFAMLGEADTAYELFAGMAPPLRSAADPDLYAAEPYVMPGNVDGPDSPYEGRAGWTWYTGSAAWMRRMAIERILGVRPQRDGLLIEPRLPKGWNGFRMRRPYRGDILDIEVKGNAPKYRLSVDGGEVVGSCVRGPGNGASLRVLATPES